MPLHTHRPAPWQHTLLTTSIASILALTLSACGSDGSSSHHTTPDDPITDHPVTDTNQFTKTATWTVDSTQLGETCYDFDTKSEVACLGTNWDVKFDNQGRSINFWTNSGTSGDGKGGVFGVIDWDELKEYPSGTTAPDGSDISCHYFSDATQGVFTEDKWYAYNLQDRHQLYPNYHVYLITTDSTNAGTQSTVQNPVYALQVINYYDAAGTSGHPTLRWIDTALPHQVQTQTYDASDNDTWVYVNLATGDTVAADGDWQVALKRNNLALNGGDIGTKNVGGYLVKVPEGFYEDDDKTQPVVDKFVNTTADQMLGALTEVANYDIPASGEVPWLTDSYSSNLNLKAEGHYPVIDYGWYVYKGNEGHRLFAKPDEDAKGTLIRSGEGDSYAKMRLIDIQYPSDTATQAASWVFEFDIQPAS